MKKILALTLAMVMCLGILAACDSGGTEPPAPPEAPSAPSAGTGNQETPGEDPTPAGRPEGAAERQALAEQYGLPYYPEIMDAWEPIEFTYFSRNAGSPPLDSNPIISVIEQITNVKIVFDYLVGDFDQAMGIMLAGGDTPDMMFVGGEANKAIESGWMMPIGDLIETYAPNLRAHYNPWWERMRSPDGEIYVANIYGTPTGRQVVFEHNDTAFWLQKDVIDFMGGPPTNAYEYFDWIKQYKEAHPTIDGIPTLGFEFDQSANYLTLMNPGAFMDGFANWGGKMLHTGGQRGGDPYEGAYARYPLDSEKEWWRILNQAHKDGLIHPETFIRIQDEYLQNIANGVVLGLHDQRWNFNSGGVDPLRQAERYERTYVSFDFTWDGVEPNYRDDRAFTGLNGINFGHNNRNPVRAIQYLDYIVQEPVQIFLSWGIENEHFFYNADGKFERTQDQRELQADPRWVIDNMGMELRNYMPKMEGTFSDGNPTGVGQSEVEHFVSMNDYDKAFYGRHGVLTEAGFMRGSPVQRPSYYPFWSMSYSRSQQNIENQLDEINHDYLPRLVMCPAADFDALWDEYCATIRAVDVSALIGAINEQALERVARAGGY